MANPNPSPETRFGAENGNPASPGGKTSEQQRHEQEAARMAAALRFRMLSTVTENLNNGSDPAEYIKGDVLKLIKDSEDRAHGTPKQTSEVNGTVATSVTFNRTIIDPSRS